jgi:hypothetical protein
MRVVHTEILGQRVQGNVVDERIAANIGTGPVRELVVDVDGAGRYPVPASAVEPASR